MPPDERLVLILSDDGKDALEHLPGARVAQWASPRVALVTGSTRGLRELASIPGVEVIDDEPESPVFERLNPTENLFARAWRRRSSVDAEPRTGEGVPWDSIGFEPPDPPRGG